MLLDREIDEIVTEKGREPGTVPCRRPTVSDALLLIMGLCVAIAWDRGRFLDGARWISLPRGASATLHGWPMALLVYAINGVEMLPPFLIAGSLVVLAIRLRKPRPGRPWLFRQPGS